MYESELERVNLRFTSLKDFDDISGILRNKSSLPGWAICLTIILSTISKPKYDLSLLKKHIIQLGDVFWIMDDIVDSIDDLENNSWSYTWL